MSSRPRRQAAKRAAPIIELNSDSDVEYVSTSKSTRSSGKTVERAERVLAGSASRHRWSTKNKKQTGTSTESSTTAAASTDTNAEDQSTITNRDEVVSGCDSASRNENTHSTAVEVNGDGQTTSTVAHNTSTALPTTTGRSSFWGRRKVWNIYELLAENERIEPRAAQNIVQLFENENTIPFICRYRRDLVDHVSPERLRDIKNAYQDICQLRKKAETIVNQLDNTINEDVRTEILCAKTSEELEFLCAPYKTAGKGTLAERAIALGLDVYADQILSGASPPVRLEDIVDPNNPDLNNSDKVLSGICNIISHNISKHTDVLEELRRLQNVHIITLKSTKAKSSATKDKSMRSSASVKGGMKCSKSTSKNEIFKFENYFAYENRIQQIKSYQILALNRGEKLKFLSIKIVAPENFKRDLKYYIEQLYMSSGLVYELRQQVFARAFEECYTKKLQPLLSRQIRSDLTGVAKKAAIDVFARNLKQLLLMSPLKGERILGIDPGFTNGCKLALISETADVVETGVIYPFNNNRGESFKWGEKLSKMLTRHNCRLIALGNGTASRQTETWLTELFDANVLDAQHIRYSIVSEQGASIYSCSEMAKKEFPTMDVNLISAVSIARRLNDPLSEYVKIEPKHIGVGMYQHDVNEKQLNESLNDVVSECVSYVGVDINTASLAVLKHIAGLTEKKAEKIIAYRNENGPFRTRQSLMKVKLIGEKTFTQCAGFIRIEPRSVGGKVENLLDCTWVHPESYVLAKKIMVKCKVNINDIGTSGFITAIKSYNTPSNIFNLTQDFKVANERVVVVLDALQRELFRDYRADFDNRPIFQQGRNSASDLKVGEVLTGAVTNITDFGTFVDIGVEHDGMIHVSKLQGHKLNIGDHISVSILTIDLNRRRIGLRMEARMAVNTER